MTMRMGKTIEDNIYENVQVQFSNIQNFWIR